MGVTVTTRLPNELVKEINFFAKHENVDKSSEVRKLIAIALTKKRIEYAMQKYKDKEISLGKAAELANVSVGRLISLLAGDNIPLNYSKKDLEEDFKAVFR